ncbi:cytochrome P450 [Crossiella cryophila]|uniref:Cytochrome P450 n=1 Tax=Crossiella cryophila TaxID=43355 RepID=A0A7W7CF85_9PSEU|nr:cytochrome P450 [Crossiella cryophila]MBB4680069.1 cytochrome P450 [Crossiella cryophila]
MTASECPVHNYPFGEQRGLDEHPGLQAARAAEGLTRIQMPYGDPAWLVTRYHDIKVVLADPRFSRTAVLGKDVARSTPAIETDMSILSMDPPEHTRLRRLVARAFTVRQVDALRPVVEETINTLLDAMAANGNTADLASALSWPLPVRVISSLLGVPVADHSRFAQWTDDIMSVNAEDLDLIIAARDGLIGYLAELIAQRRAQPGEDLLSKLVEARDLDDRLDETELVVFGMTLLLAGHETTANQIGNFLFQLLSRPELWKRLVAEPELVPGAVEELLRHTPLASAGNFPRMAIEDVELGGTLVRAGEVVVVHMAAGNRDETVFPDAATIDLTRDAANHIAFGHGAHHCLGARLARVELQLVLSALISRFPGLHLTVPAEEVPWRTARLVNGVSSLPVGW